MKCEIIPQVRNLQDELVDSNLFANLLKSNDRETAKELYAYVHSPKFKETYGDWELKKNIQLNRYTDDESAVFLSRYNGNLDNIKLKIDIDENGEPIFNNEDLSNSQHNEKEINSIFEQNLELSDIGSQEQYSEYLNTIFPNSKVKDILYHGSNTSNLESLDPSKAGTLLHSSMGKGVYISNNKNVADRYKGKIPISQMNEILKNNPEYKGDFSEFAEGQTYALLINAENLNTDYTKVNDPNVFVSYIEPINSATGKTMQSEYIVKDSSKIHILGSKQDIKGFKEWIKNNIDNTSFLPIFNNDVREDISNNNVGLSKEQIVKEKEAQRILNYLSKKYMIDGALTSMGEFSSYGRFDRTRLKILINRDTTLDDSGNLGFKNLNNIKRSSIFHEYLHPFVEILEKANPELYEELHKSAEVLNKEQPFAEINHYDATQQKEELIVRYLDRLSKDDGAPTLLQKFITWLSSFIHSKRINDKETLQNLSKDTTVEQLYNIFKNYGNLKDEITKVIEQDSLKKELELNKKLLNIAIEEKLPNENIQNYKDEIEKLESLINRYDKSNVQYKLKAVNILQSDAAKQVFAKGNKNGWDLNKILTELQIPKEQKQLVIDSYNEGNKTPEQLAIDIASKYGYNVEVNTAKNVTKQFGAFEQEPGIPMEAIMQSRYSTESEKGNPTSYYANLTVPGGINYTENEISTPLITPSIKGHAQFATDKGIGWFRSDEQNYKGEADVILPIGTSGSGKSTFIKTLPQENLVVIEPDVMRVEFTGDVNDKSKDKEIYEEAAKRAITAIKRGKQVVFDTTNLTKNKRTPFINAIKKALPTANIQYKLMELNPELAKQRIKAQIAKGENRANVPDSTIDRHAESYKQMLEDIKSEPISEYKDKQPTKTRRILELQSDLFQKGRDKNKLAGIGEDESFLKPIKGTEDELGIPDFEKDTDLIRQNQFLQLLNKDNNWVTFFIKSIIQDSAKKGYEKVLFPTGETAAKVEGHETIANEIEKKNKELDKWNDTSYVISHDLEDKTKFDWWDKEGDNMTYHYYKLNDKYYKSGTLISKDEFENKYNELLQNDKDKFENNKQENIDRITKEKQELKSQGIEKLKPIEAFYEIKVGNILEKQFGKDNIKTITDEYGNQWREITLDKNRDLEDIMFPKNSEDISSNSLPYTPDYKFHQHEINHTNKLISRIAIDILPELKNLKVEDLANNISVKNSIISALQTILNSKIDNNSITNSQLEFVNKVIDDLKMKDSEIYNNFKLYFNSNYNIKINDLEDLTDENGNVTDEITKAWADEGQLEENLMDKVSNFIKFKIANLRNVPSELSGISDGVDINEIWSVLQTVHANDITPEDYMDTLDVISKLNETLIPLKSLILSDEIFKNAYISTFKKSINETFAITFESENKKILADYAIQNRNSFPSNVLYDKYLYSLKYFTQHGDTAKFNTILKQIKDRIKNDNSKITSLEASRLLEAMGINIPAIGLDIINEYKLKFLNSNIEQLKSTIGVDTTPAELNKINKDIEDLQYQKENARFLNIANPIVKLAENISEMIKDEKVKFDSRGDLRKIATISSIVNSHKGDFSFLDVNGNKRFSVDYPSFITDMFKEASASTLGIQQAFGKYIEISKNKYSNWLVNTAGKNTPNGIFNLDETGQINKLNPVNVSFFSNKFAISFFNGIKNLTEEKGSTYDEMVQGLWDYATIVSFLTGDYNSKGEQETAYYRIPSSDSPRMLTIKAPVFTVTDLIKYDTNFKVVGLNKEHSTFQTLRNTMLQELEEAYVARDAIYDPILKDGRIIGFKPKELYDASNPENALHTLHDVKHCKLNGEEIQILDNNKMPIGRVYKMTNLSYKVDGKEYTFEDYLKEKYKTLNLLTYNNFEEAKASLKTSMDEFIDTTITKRINDNTNNFESLREIIGNTSLRVPGRKRESKSIINSDKDFNDIVAKFTVNDYLAMVEINNMFLGNNSEYGSSDKWNKRVGQGIKKGQQLNSDRLFNALTVNDIFYDSPIFKQIEEVSGKTVANMFKHIDASDAFSYITIEEYEHRLREAGIIESYKPILEALKNRDVAFNPALYNKFLESLKFFYYDRDVKELPYKQMVSVQQKNSTMVLAPALIKNTDLENLYNDMKLNNVDQINFKSAEKVGGTVPVDIFKNGKYVPLSSSIVEQEVIPSKVSGLKLQLEVKPHLMDEVNKLAIQLSKSIFTNVQLENEIYKIGDETVSGQKLFDDYNKILATNIKESALGLLKSWGAVQNGEIRSDENGNIIVDITKISKQLLQYVMNESLDNNALAAVKMTDTGESAMPIYAPIHYKKFSSILLSKITKNIIEQKLPGFHSPIVPNVLFNPSNVSSDSKMDMKELVEKGQITYLNSVKEDIIAGKRTSNLKYEIVEKEDGKHLEVECVVNPWDSKFIKYDEKHNPIGYMDINDIPEEALHLLGIRIPVEGKQSMVYFKVVGFLNSGATQIVFPSELITQTGWDFDIDSLFAYTKNLEFNKDGKLQVVKYSNDNEELFNAWKRDRLATNLASLTDNDRAEIHNLKNIAGDIREGMDSIFKTEIQSHHANLEGMFKFQNDYIETVLNDLKDEFEIERSSKTSDPDAMTIDDTKIHDLVDLKNQLLKFADNYDIDASFGKYIDGVRLEIQNFNNKINSDTENIKKSYDDLNNLKIGKQSIEARIDKLYHKIFDNLSFEEKHTLASRQNRIVDTFTSILNNPAHLAEKIKPNEMQHSINAANLVNELYQTGAKGLNPNFYEDYNLFRNINMSIRALKGNSVGWDSIMSIMGVLGVKFREGSSVKFKLHESYLPKNFKIEDAKSKVLNVTKKGGFYTFDINTLFNNESKTWTDILDENITTQYSETTSHILDAVTKLLGFNLNIHTLPVYKLISSLPFNSQYEFNGVRENNRFVVPNLLIHQPIILEYVKGIIDKNITTSVNKKSIQQDIMNDYIARMLVQMRPILDNAVVNLKSKYNKDTYKYSASPDDLRSIMKTIYYNIEAHGGYSSFSNGILTTRVATLLQVYSDYTEHEIELGTNPIIPDIGEMIQSIKDRSSFVNVINSSYVPKLNSEQSITGKDVQSIDLQREGIKTALIQRDKPKYKEGDNVTFGNDNIIYHIDSMTRTSLSSKTSEETLSKIATAEGTNLTFLKKRVDSGSMENGVYFVKFHKTDMTTANKDAINYLATQLQTLHTYSYLDGIAQGVIAYSAILNADKKKVGPDTSISDLNEYRMRNILVDKANLKEHLLKNGYKTNQINEINRVLDSLPTNEMIPFLENEVGYSAPSILTLDDHSLIESVYEAFNTEESKYPILNAFYENGQRLSQKLMANLSIYDNDKFKEFKNSYLVGISNNTQLTDTNERINNFFINFMLRDLNLFTYDNENSFELNKDVATKQLRTRINSFNSSYEDNHKTLELTPENFEAFQQLTLSNKIRLIQDNPVYKEYFNNPTFENNHILNVLNIQDDKDIIESKGRIFIKIGDTSDANMTSFSMKDMYFKDPFLRDIVTDLTRYAYFNFGLSFGNNLSKFIPVELLTNPKSNLGEYGDALKGVKSQIFSQMFDPDFKQLLHQSNIDNTNINPIAYSPTKVIPGNVYAKFKLVKAAIPLGDTHLIFETNESLAFHNLAMKDYIVKLIGEDKVLFKKMAMRLENGDNLYVYYPIESHDMYEFTDAANNRNRRYKEGASEFVIAPEEFYKGMQEMYDPSVLLQIYNDTNNIKVETNMDTPEKNSVDLETHKDESTSTWSNKFKEEGRQVFYIYNENKDFSLNILKNSNEVGEIRATDYNDIVSNLNINSNKIVLSFGQDFKNKDAAVTAIAFIHSMYPEVNVGILNNSNLTSEIVNEKVNSLNVFNSNTLGRSIEQYSEDLGFDVSTKLDIHNASETMLGMLENNLRLKNMFQNRKLTFAKELNTLDDKIIKSKIGEELNKDNISSILEGMDMEIGIFTHINKTLSTIGSEFKGINTDELYKKGEESKVEFVSRLKEAQAISSMYDYIDRLDKISLSSAREEDSSTIEMINSRIAKLKEMKEESARDRKQVKEAVDTYLATIIYNTSRNSKSFNTAFEKAREGIDTSITKEELAENMIKMLRNNEDISGAMLWFDSSFNTGIAMVDNTMLEYFKYMGARDEMRDSMIDDVNELMKKLTPGVENVLSHHNKAKRTSNFTTTMFDSKNGTLISKFKWEDYRQAEREALKAFSESMKRIDALTIENDNLLKSVDPMEESEENTTINKRSSDLVKQMEVIRRNAQQNLKKFYNENRSQESLTTEEATELDSLLANNSPKIVNKWLNNHHVKEYKGKYYKIIPSDKYLNEDYAKMKDSDKEILDGIKNVIAKITKTCYGFEVSDDFFPINLSQTATSAIKQVVGYRRIYETQKELGLNDEEYFKHEFPMFNYVEFHPIYKIRPRRIGEDFEEYEDKVVKSINYKHKLKGEQAFTSLEEIRTANLKNSDLNKRDTVENMTADPYEALKLFIYQSANFKHTVDFETLFGLLLDRVKSDDFSTTQTRMKGTGVVNTLGSLLKGERDYKTVKGQDTNVAKRLETFLSTLNGEHNVRNRVEQVLAIAKQYTSLTYMSLNVTGAIKNIGQGYMNIMQEAFAKEFISHKDIGWAIKNYNITKIVASLGEEYSDDINTAIMKRFGNMLELKNENGFETNIAENNAHRILMSVNAMYFLNSAGEHFMQFTTLLAAMRSHRVLNGVFVNFNEFYNDKRKQVLGTILNKEQKESLDKYLDYMNKNNPRHSDNPDFIARWMTNNNLTDVQKTEYIQKIKEAEKAAREEFDKLETVYDQYELKDGRAVIKEGSKFTDDQSVMFERRVQQLNHSIHGIYNQIDRSKLRNSLLGDMAMQFRAWIRPNFVRYFGQRWGRSVYNEALGSFRKGAWNSMQDFITSPFKMAKYNSRELTSKQAFVNIMKAYGEFFANLRFNYRAMNIQDRQNIRRNMGNFINIAMSIAGLLLLNALSDDDEKDNPYMLSFALYELNALYNEHTELLPGIGWYKSIIQAKQYLTPSERIVDDTFSILYTLTTYPFLNPEDRVFSNGMYNGEDKLKIAIMKNTPLFRQYHKMMYIPLYNNWYKAYNPIYISSSKKN